MIKLIIEEQGGRNIVGLGMNNSLISFSGVGLGGCNGGESGGVIFTLREKKESFLLFFSCREI